MIIEKNFLENKLFNSFCELLTGPYFSWYYQPQQVNQPGKKDISFLSHLFVNDNKINSDYYNPFIGEIVKKLNAKYLINVRANLTIKRGKQIKSLYHNDYDLDSKTALLYLNTCNGYTEFKKDKKIIKSEANKVCIFPSRTVHRSVTQSDIENRIVLNINYYE